jgi:serine/threonine protein kinase
VPAVLYHRALGGEKLSHLLGSRYVLHELLARGSVGYVFRGSARADGYPVAVKMLKPELMSDPEVFARFLQERSILTSVSHRHVVRVLDLVVEGERAGIVMELVRGQDLRHHLSGRCTLPPAQSVHFARQLLEGAAAVHAAGIIHRDVKPENVLVDASEDEVILKLTDFGIARLSYRPTLTRQASLLGTPEYMAPELAHIAPVTPAADLYSIGIVLYEMLAGRTPFAGGHPMTVLHRHLEQVPAPIPGARADLWALVEWLLAKDPRSRPSSAAEAAAALGRLEPELAGEPALPPMPLLPQMPEPPMAPTPGRSSMAKPAVRAGASPDPALSRGYPQPADPTDLDHPATVLSHLYRQDYPDGYAPTGDWVQHAPPPPAKPAARAPEPPRSRVNSRLMLALVAAVVLVLAATIGLLSRPAPESAAAVSAAVSYTFAPQEYPDGLVITRRWTLGGRYGSMLTETVSAGSVTGQGLRVAFQDEIPAAVAPTTHTVVFTPAPTKIVKADPVVEWLLRLPSHGTVQVGYHATVPALGVTMARLMGLVKDFDALQAAATALGLPKPRTIQLTSLAIEPGAVKLKRGGRIRLGLTGRLSDGQAAPRAVLGNATWNPANPAVASVTSPGTVTGVSVGITYVTAQIGSAQASVLVTVAAVDEVGAGGVGAGGVGHRTAQEISFTSAPPPSPVTGVTYAVAASGGDSGNRVTFTVDSSSGSVCSISASTVTFNQPGRCVIDANQAGNAKYQPAPQAQQAITVNAAAQAISFTAPASGSVGGSAALSATGGESGNPVVFTVASSGAGVCSVSGANGTTVSYLAAGSCVIDANQAGNASYQAAPQIQRTITVNAAAQAISFTAPASGSVGGSASLSATGGESGNPVVFTVASSGAGVCSVSGANGTTVSYLAAGSCVIDANQAGNASYQAAPQVLRTITVSNPVAG